ncbi:ABC transporter ATP-binding protein [Thermoflexus sp.]|uniref:ABC transporter ATP-binding protein n=1 Tax=Thermoflexus sp. TaxID=1969742 RepID=UPI0025D172B0|nr:ABC transporter ATP-binding protein [Thermoflexus sp.]MDW8181492.1 ABC transporter ATP-binding protein [Anaerolineae bacterium]MCS6963401.1 ABC transporter ATP-binding protein [Thermoflexus sp.]MCS7352033.1 ABC transporter ATP-binding protein [Thermoflexus sp.]MCX7691659.1 ABC transporter ATP-binding protein [Thermoflexus sp.]MDW8183828.1 ABC transporter ATP-binding protein [Anaerolineae bacterium]
MAFLVLEHVSKRFGNLIAVEDFHLAVEKGEFISLLGPSGCGKTTVLRMIAGFELPTTGRIILEGEDITRVPPNRRNIGMVFQSYALFPNMTVAQNIAFGMRVRREPEHRIRERVDELLALVHLEDKRNSYPHQLSGGQQQRVALARALAIRPRLLLLDEPLSALDAKIRVTLRSEIRAIQRQLGITVIYVTHDQEEALSISDRIVVMRAGKIEQVGTPFQIYNFPQTSFVASFVGMLNTAEAEVLDPQQGLLQLDGAHLLSADPGLRRRKPGERVRLSIRPERISLAGEQLKDNLLQARVEDITFLGAVVRIQLRLGNTLFYMDTFNNPHLALPTIGSTVQVTCSKEAVMVLE